MAEGAGALVVRLSSLGDVLLSTPVFENLKAARPSGRTAVLVKRAFAPVFAGNPFVDEVLVFEDRGLLGWARDIRRRRFDLILDLHDTPRSRFWSLFSGAGRRLRYDKRTWERRRLVRTKEASPALAGSVTDRYLEVLGALGIEAPSRAPRLFLEGDALGPELGRRVGEGPFLGVAPGAAHATKRWPPERFAEAADRLMETLAGGKVLILGSAGDKPSAEAVAARLKSPCIDLAGRTSLRDLFHLMARCRLVLANDSGAMHAAAALGVRTVAVFGPTVEAFGFYPKGPRTSVVRAGELPCRPCHLHGLPSCPEGHFQCMLDIPASRVAETARKLVESGS